MTETRTLRLGLPQWSSGTQDSPSREDFNEAFANLETLLPPWTDGPLAVRPTPEVVGRYYTDSDTGTIYRDTGTAWQTVGTPTNELKIVKTSGTNPALTLEVPSGQTGDALLTRHNNQVRLRVDAVGDVTASSIRFYQSNTAAPASNLPHTLGIVTKSASATGISIYGQQGQSGNFLEALSNTGGKIKTVDAAGNDYTIGRGSYGTLSPGDSQFYVKGAQESRPVVLMRSSNTLLGAGPVLVAESNDGTFQLLKVDASGRMALGSRGNKNIINTDHLALNTNYTGTNNATSGLPQGRLVFRNTTSGYGVGAFEIQQEPGDGPSSASLGIYAGLAGENGVAPERVRLGINSAKHGARFTASAPDWTPLVVRGAPGQSVPLLIAQRDDGTVLAQLSPAGDLTLNKVTALTTEPSTFAGPLSASGPIQGTSLRAIQGTGTDAGVTSQIKKTAESGTHFLAQDEDGIVRARLNRDGTLEIASDTSVVAAEAVLLTMRGQQYRQNGRKFQSWDAAANRWGSFESAFAAEYYATSSQNVTGDWTPINWGGEANDTENAFDHTTGQAKVKVPFTGWYDIRALAHINMNFTGSGASTLRINGTVNQQYRRNFPRALGFDVCTVWLNDIVYLNRNDVIEYMVAIDSFIFNTYTLYSGTYRSRMVIRFAGNA